MAELREMPLFPLHTVLFPGMVLPLHIFEPRYKLMISACVKENKPFGVALIKEGQEVGGPARTYAFGTSAYITQIEQLEGERMNIQAVGFQRFKLHEVREDRPYMVGVVEDSPVPGEDDPLVGPTAEMLAPLLEAYLGSLKKVSALGLSFDEIPREGRALAYLTAIMLPLRTNEKQLLLESDNLLAMLTMQVTFVRRELLFLKHMMIPDQNQHRELLFSKN